MSDVELTKIDTYLWRYKIADDAWLWMGWANEVFVTAQTTTPDAVAEVRGYLTSHGPGAELMSSAGDRVTYREVPW